MELATFYIKYSRNNINKWKICENCKDCKDKYYYSIDKKYDRCGETCLKPNKAWFIKIFEGGMLLAVSHGYPIKNPSDYYEKEEPK